MKRHETILNYIVEQTAPPFSSSRETGFSVTCPASSGVQGMAASTSKSDRLTLHSLTLAPLTVMK